jgi:Tol biopolymer transport system component
MLPNNYQLNGYFQVSPDGQKVFFSANSQNGQERRIYRIDIDGTNLLLIADDVSLETINQAL